MWLRLSLSLKQKILIFQDILIDFLTNERLNTKGFSATCRAKILGQVSLSCGLTMSGKFVAVISLPLSHCSAWSSLALFLNSPVKLPNGVTVTKLNTHCFDIYPTLFPCWIWHYWTFLGPYCLWYYYLLLLPLLLWLIFAESHATTH